MSSSNCCFLTCIQVSQEAGQVVWYFHPFQNLPQFIVSHTVKGFGIFNKAEIDAFLELSCFFDDPADVGNLLIHKKNEIMSFTAKRMDLEIVILSEVSQAEKIKYHGVTYMWNLKKRYKSIYLQIEIELQM